MKHLIKNEVDYMVARAQAETNAVRKLLEDSQKENDYWKEKVAAKLMAFHEHEEKMLSIYADIKSYHPELATALEKRRPYLLSILARAGDQWEKQRERQASPIK
ncbi:MAG: hypothetical protein KAI72_02640 [Candidatus Pacebacteria bacterium]|nr:hypothetical protein [Candidatus Paceibacterota bacterium]